MHVVVLDSGSANLTNKALSENVETVFRLTGAPVVDVLATLHDARARAKALGRSGVSREGRDRRRPKRRLPQAAWGVGNSHGDQLVGLLRGSPYVHGQAP